MNDKKPLSQFNKAYLWESFYICSLAIQYMAIQVRTLLDKLRIYSSDIMQNMWVTDQRGPKKLRIKNFV